MKGTSNEELTVLARAAAAGDRAAAKRFVSGIQDNVYELSLRMLGHPADAEDAGLDASLSAGRRHVKPRR